MVHKYDSSKSYESLFCRGNQYSGCWKFDVDVVLTLKDAPQSEFNVTWNVSFFIKQNIPATISGQSDCAYMIYLI